MTRTQLMTRMQLMTRTQLMTRMQLMTRTQLMTGMRVTTGTLHRMRIPVTTSTPATALRCFAIASGSPFSQAQGALKELAKLLPEMATRVVGGSLMDTRAWIPVLSPRGVLSFLEANRNPEIAGSEEFASAAKHVGIDYQEFPRSSWKFWNVMWRVAGCSACPS